MLSSTIENLIHSSRTKAIGPSQLVSKRTEVPSLSASLLLRLTFHRTQQFGRPSVFSPNSSIFILLSLFSSTWWERDLKLLHGLRRAWWHGKDWTYTDRTHQGSSALRSGPFSLYGTFNLLCCCDLTINTKEKVLVGYSILWKNPGVLRLVESSVAERPQVPCRSSERPGLQASKIPFLFLHWVSSPMFLTIWCTECHLINILENHIWLVSCSFNFNISTELTTQCY